MPGNNGSGDQRVVGSVRPPRHWRTNAKAARVKGRIVSIKRSLEVNDDDEEVEEEGAVGLRDGCRPPAIGNQ